MPIRESDVDRNNEDRVAGIIEKKFKCEAQPTETLCPYDFVCMRDGKRMALLEVRRRNCPHDQHDALFFGRDKYRQLHQLSLGYGRIPIIFVVAFADGDFWVDLMRTPMLDETYGSRGDNPEGGERATDNECCVLIPVTLFRQV